MARGARGDVAGGSGGSRPHAAAAHTDPHLPARAECHHVRPAAAVADLSARS